MLKFYCSNATNNINKLNSAFLLHENVLKGNIRDNLKAFRV